MRRESAVLFLGLLVACGSPSPEDQLTDIRRWEDGRRVDAVDSLAVLLDHAAPPVRAAAARAIGRIGHPGGRGPLEAALGADHRPEVRGEAAFALGILGDPAALRALGAQLAREEDAWALGETALALGRLGEHAATPHLLPLVESGHPHVREQALEALALLGDSTAVDTILEATDDPLESVRWRAAYALEKIPGTAQAPRLIELTRDPSSLVRRYAIRSLGRIEAESGVDAIVDALGRAGLDWQVEVMACDALGRLGGAAAQAALASRLTSANAHVRVSALQGLGRQKARAELHRILDLTDDPVVDVRLAAYTAVADCLEGRGFDTLRRGIDDRSPLVAARCLARLGESTDPRTVATLREVFADPDRTALRFAAMDGLGRTGDAAPHGLIVTALQDDDWMVAVMAAGALEEVGTADDVDTLLAAHAHWEERDNADVRQQILTTLGTLGDERAVPLLRRVLHESSDRSLRSAALASLNGLLDEAARAQLPTPEDLAFDVRPVERSPRQPPLVTGSRARQLALHTERGPIVIDLFHRDAPQTVETFARLAENGFFDGLTFHRVVPNFVVQGGDPLGIGWGDAGFRIRSEWNPRRYERGVVGIAHSGKDTGSCQLFITMSPQPHLNGRYTIWGEVVSGLEVVDTLQMGDQFSAEVRWAEPTG